VVPWLLNLIVPGTGLILARREWLGFLLAVIFGICGNVALAGGFIAPAAIPPWLTGVAAVLTLLAWVVAQVLLRRHLAQPRTATPVSDFSDD
jgi:hypothetical protein